MRLLALTLTSLLVPTAPPAAPRDGVELIRAMHAAYAGKWYRSVTFVQKTAYPNARVETWYEAMALPGRLRIDVAPLDSMQTMIFRNDSIYQYAMGRLQGSQAMVHPLLLLGFDVHVQPPEVTIQKLPGLGFDLGRIREDSWQGRKHWIVGALVGDSLSREFWVEQERLLFTRMVQSAPRGPDTPGKRNLVEIHFTDYQRAGEGWIAAKVGFFNNGERVQSEDYQDIVVNPVLPDELFEPGAWKRPDWVK
jgi:hypothetical protein